MTDLSQQNGRTLHYSLWLTKGRVALIIFYFGPALVYFGLVSGFDFSFFAPHFGWEAYNQYFLSMIEGRLDVPAEAIGREGSYLNGKAYMYYGALPTIIRMAAFPFVDLDVTPISRLSVWIFSVAAVSVLQWRLLATFRQISDGTAMGFRFTILCLVSLIFWFASAHTVIIEQATIYHEPFAASLLLLAVYLALVSGDLMFASGERRYRLLAYAVIAALSLHARPTTAISLYAATVFLIGAAVIEEAKLNTIIAEKRLSKILKVFVTKGVAPLLILGIGGSVLLSMNYARFDNPFSMSGGVYGFTLGGEGYSERVCSRLAGHTRFEFLRIIPNTIYYVFGGIDLYPKLANFLDTGFVIRESPYMRMSLFWTMGIASVVLFVWLNFFSAIRREKRAIVLGGVFFALLIGVFLQLAYTTIRYRYMVDLWPPMGLGLLFAWHYFSTRTVNIDNRSSKYIVAGLYMVLALNVTYIMGKYDEYRHKYDNYNLHVKFKSRAEIEHALAGERPLRRDISKCEKYDWWPEK